MGIDAKNCLVWGTLEAYMDPIIEKSDPEYGKPTLLDLDYFVDNVAMTNMKLYDQNGDLKTPPVNYTSYVNTAVWSCVTNNKFSVTPSTDKYRITLHTKS